MQNCKRIQLQGANAHPSVTDLFGRYFLLDVTVVNPTTDSRSANEKTEMRWRYDHDFEFRCTYPRGAVYSDPGDKGTNGNERGSQATGCLLGLEDEEHIWRADDSPSVETQSIWLRMPSPRAHQTEMRWGACS
jgi:hypothetical protein